MAPTATHTPAHLQPTPASASPPAVAEAAADPGAGDFAAAVAALLQDCEARGRVTLAAAEQSARDALHVADEAVSETLSTGGRAVMVLGGGIGAWGVVASRLDFRRGSHGERGPHG